MAKKPSAAIKLTAKYPDPESWKYETIEDGGAERQISIYEGKDLEDADIRNKRYDLDATAWCRKHYFWNAEEAALISFGRDPDKVVSRDEYVPRDNEDEDFKKHLELLDHIEKRVLLIKHAQEKGGLPEFFPPAMYIEWGKRSGFYIPKFVHAGLEKVEREREAMSQGKRPSIFPGIYLDPVEMSEDDSEQDAKKKGPSQQKKYENNLTKILLALLIKSDLIKKDPGDLSKTLAEILATKAHEEGDERLAVKDDTIKLRLKDAHELLK
jgi:hypothetical protein